MANGNNNIDGALTEEDFLDPHISELWSGFLARNNLDPTRLAQSLAVAFNIENKLATVQPVNVDDFIYLHIEPLLDQSADLLDRLLNDRKHYDEQKIKQGTLAFEFLEFELLDPICSEEIASGKYKIPYQAGVHELKAEESQQQMYTDAIRALDTLIGTQWTDAKVTELINSAALAASAQGYQACKQPADQIPERIQYPGLGGAAEFISDVLSRDADKQSSFTLKMQQAAIKRERMMHANNESVSEQRKIALSTELEWNRRNGGDDELVGYMERRRNKSKEVMKLRMDAATSANGVLNYEKYLTGLGKRMTDDFGEALSRMAKAQAGLFLLYGWDLPQPDAADINSYPDDCLLWVRRAIQLLIRFARKDQNAVMALSLRSLIGEERWNNGLLAGNWSLEVDERSVFPQLRHVRLRGISMVAIPQPAQNEQTWRVAVTPPQRATVRHLNNRVENLDQSELRPCLLGRVSGIESIQQPDVAGASLLLNASPIGEWTIAVTGLASMTGAASDSPDPAIELKERMRRELGDLHLHLHLAFRTKQQ